ncbi:MAG: metalloregulator ArsR/SmtB family transcription factor [Anaerolineae bacterium]
MSDDSVPGTAAFFAALADPTRLALVRLLASLPEGHRQCVRALAWRLGVSQPAVSQHLRVLRDIGLVSGERSGRRMHYSLDRDQLLVGKTLLQQITDTPRAAPERPPEAGHGRRCAERAIKDAQPVEQPEREAREEGLSARANPAPARRPERRPAAGSVPRAPHPSPEE